jgi:hypothetical protein
LFEHAALIQVSPDNARVYIHASLDRDRDWKAWASQYPAHWQRESSASGYGYFDYSGVVKGVEVSILQAEKREEPQPLFAEEVVE